MRPFLRCHSSKYCYKRSANAKESTKLSKIKIRLIFILTMIQIYIAMVNFPPAQRIHSKYLWDKITFLKLSKNHWILYFSVKNFCYCFVFFIYNFTFYILRERNNHSNNHKTSQNWNELYRIYPTAHDIDIMIWSIFVKLFILLHSLVQNILVSQNIGIQNT